MQTPIVPWSCAICSSST